MLRVRYVEDEAIQTSWTCWVAFMNMMHNLAPKKLSESDKSNDSTERAESRNGDDGVLRSTYFSVLCIHTFLELVYI